MTAAGNPGRNEQRQSRAAGWGTAGGRKFREKWTETEQSRRLGNGGRPEIPGEMNRNRPGPPDGKRQIRPGCEEMEGKRYAAK